MEEKKVCTECEAREQKLEELTQEEVEKVAGGVGSPDKEWVCSQCRWHSSIYSKNCEKCGAPWL